MLAKCKYRKSLVEFNRYYHFIIYMYRVRHRNVYVTYNIETSSISPVVSITCVFVNLSGQLPFELLLVIWTIVDRNWVSFSSICTCLSNYICVCQLKCQYLYYAECLYEKEDPKINGTYEFLVKVYHFNNKSGIYDIVWIFWNSASSNCFLTCRYVSKR